MSRSARALVLTLAALVCFGGDAPAQELSPDHYLCYAAGAAASKRVERITKVRVDVEDRYGGPQVFAVQRFGALCNPATLDGSLPAHHNIHLAGINIKKLKSAPKFTPFTQAVTDVFGTRTLGLTALASLLDVTPAQNGTNAPADFSDDPTRTGTETNRFKCYSEKLPKGAPKFEPPASPIVFDEVYPNGQQFQIKKVTKLCVPADVEGATPGAPGRDSLLVCYAVKLPKGVKFPRQMVGTRSRSVGVRIVGRRKPLELCVVGRLFPAP